VENNYSYNSKINYRENANVTFTKNIASSWVVQCISAIIIEFTGTSKVSFLENVAAWGVASACSADKSIIAFKQNEMVFIWQYCQ